MAAKLHWQLELPEHFWEWRMCDRIRRILRDWDWGIASMKWCCQGDIRTPTDEDNIIGLRKILRCLMICSDMVFRESSNAGSIMETTSSRYRRMRFAKFIYREAGQKFLTWYVLRAVLKTSTNKCWRMATECEMGFQHVTDALSMLTGKRAAMRGEGREDEWNSYWREEEST
jgi:hypothetical protein